MIFSISQRLKTLRNNLGMNQFEFAQYLNIKQSTLSAYERDISNPSLDVLLMIAEKCNVSMDWLCSKQTNHHLITMADVILALGEIYDLEGLNPSVETTQNSFAIIVNGIASQNDMDIDSASCTGHLCKFLHDWKTTKDQLKNLPDTDITKKYMQMWWKEQIAHYSVIPVKRKEKYIKDWEDIKILEKRKIEK